MVVVVVLCVVLCICVVVLWCVVCWVLGAVLLCMCVLINVIFFTRNTGVLGKRVLRGRTS